ncbi:MAG: hypothetical protein IJ379_10850 [Lachnospiraceae bacterium]|nr:hypothetical protein [Lachnospiraceae bacterium]
MSVQYLKKAKMFELLQMLIVDKDCSLKLKYCEYKFYRGSEWLKFCNDDGIIFSLYHKGVGVSLDLSYLDGYDREISIDRLTFAYLDNSLILNYWRNGKNDYICPSVANSKRCAG